MLKIKFYSRFHEVRDVITFDGIKFVKTMNFLLINKYHYLKGGDCRAYFNQGHLLEEKEHNVFYFSQKTALNVPYEHDSFFLSEIDFNNHPDLMKVINRSIYSREAKNSLASYLETLPQIDVALIHNIHSHITPSILPVLKKRGIKVLWTLHDYILICPNYTFLDGNDEICEKCKGRKYYQCILNKCKKGSLLPSVLTAIVPYLYRVLKSPMKSVDYFITPSEFMRQKMIEFGYEENKVVAIHNFINTSDSTVPPPSEGKYALYLGRLSGEKGLFTLVCAFEGLDFPLYLVGDGPLRPTLENIIKEKKINNIHLLGYKAGNELENLKKGCRFFVIPSEWYENYPYSIIENFSYQKPGIGSSIGGIPELIKDGETGFTFKPGDPKELREKLIEMINLDASKLNRYGSQAFHLIKAECSSEKYYHELMKLIEAVQ